MHRTGLEPVTTRFEAGYSIQLSYQCLFERVDINRAFVFLQCLNFSKKSLSIHISLLLARMKKKTGAMKQERCEGIVLRSIDFKERQKIVTVFTREKGLLSVIIKGISYKKSHLVALSSLFCEGEFIFRRTRGDIGVFLDGSIIEESLFLREDYTYLQTAGSLAKAVLHSQMPQKPAPLLFELLKAYIKQIKNIDPHLLLASYYLKLLQHEGLFNWNSTCSICQKSPANFLENGDNLCSEHASMNARSFSKEEAELVGKLSSLRKFGELAEVKASFDFYKKIENYFKESTS